MLYLKEEISDTILGVWQIEESKEELLHLLGHHDWLGGILSIKSESRILEMLAVRVLLKELAGDEKEIVYYPSGRPYLKDASCNISVSHTKGYVAVALNQHHKVGIDIEKISDKIRRVQSRIISEREHIDKDNELIHLLLHWSAKEAMFKLLDVEGVDFLKHLYIHPFTPQIRGWFKASESRTNEVHNFSAFYQVETDFVLSYLILDN
ncbi:4'-phosphopantetheinyl transferase superfamily protein [Dysgonomonas sp. ZJ709]|uniref:4'-phosphopantetheinyl transferase family protein n=1 Tax=Dysgonomonas sp. ZJ709 TaxID=2709797 RepID=UPI0013EB3887|nr:4'-phosphopantetheinyl transferase superfamily protein [Dysgonomonas sp. ZJ709]